MQDKDSDAANTALQIYLACIRKLLRSFDGYECQEADGSFMLAFKDPIDAVLFCLTVRSLLLAVCLFDRIASCGTDAQSAAQYSAPVCRLAERHRTLQIQEEMVTQAWSDEVLRLAACKRVHGPANEVLFLGPRVKMGIYEGRPTRICPHTTTGRADYFGPFVNRQALPHCTAVALIAQLWRNTATFYQGHGTM